MVTEDETIIFITKNVMKVHDVSNEKWSVQDIVEENILCQLDLKFSIVCSLAKTRKFYEVLNETILARVAAKCIPGEKKILIST